MNNEKTPIVSVIIPCYNAELYLEKAVESVLSQTFSDLECIIVNDGSTDNTRQVSEALMQRDSRIRYFYKENGGLNAARNFGIRHARGEWIQHLDSDDWLHEDKIRFQLECSQRLGGEEKVVLYSDYEVVWQNPNGNVVKRVVNLIGDLTSEQLLERMIKWSFKANIPLHANNTLFKKAVFEEKMFNETFRAFGDVELFVDLLLKNVNFIYTPLVGMFYRVHQSNLSKDKVRIRYAYIRYLEEIREKDKELLQLCPNIGKLIKEAIIENDKDMFNKLIDLIRSTKIPVYFSTRRVPINNILMLKLAYFLNLRLPDHEEKLTAQFFIRELKRIVRRGVHFLFKLPARIF